MASEVLNPHLAKLIADLPEIYQPVYSHPELSNTVSRSCVDRLANITSVYDALQTLLDRPLRVLDLGCAQGFFSLALAERGASVYGIDFLDKNIEVCNALAAENPNVQVIFEVDHIQAMLQRLEPDQYDLVLGLSVFHHIIHEQGVGVVRDLLDHAAQCVGVLITEIALREEPLYWATSQPEDSRVLLKGFAFVHEMARHETHLSSIHRPLYVASNRYWVLDGHAAIFESWTTEPHTLAKGYHQDTRHYYFSANHVVKIFQLNHLLGERNREEILRETSLLADPPIGFRTTASLVSGLHETEAWSVVDRIPGKLLIDVIHEGLVIDSLSILYDVIQQLASLEAVGLYHDDLRMWNILIDSDGKVWLIDYGSIAPKARNFGWPDNIYLAFFIFVREIATGVVEHPDPLRTVSISPFNLPQPYRAWAMALWKRPLKEWSFKLMLQLLDALPHFDQSEGLAEPSEVWAKAIEEAIQLQKQFGQHLKWKLDVVENQQHNLLQPFMNSHARLAESMEKQIAWLQQQFVHGQESLKRAESRAQEQESRALAAESRAQEQESRALAAESRAQEQESRALAAESRAQEQEQRKITLEAQFDEVNVHAHRVWQRAEILQQRVTALESSLSWRITAPLRSSFDIIKGSFVILASIARYPLVIAMRAVLARPGLAYRLNQSIMRYPTIHQRLFTIASRAGLIQGFTPSPLVPPPINQDLNYANRSGHENNNLMCASLADLPELTVRARKIYRELKIAFEYHHRQRAN